jgi:hypothetical protein
MFVDHAKFQCHQKVSDRDERRAMLCPDEVSPKRSCPLGRPASLQLAQVGILRLPFPDAIYGSVPAISFRLVHWSI